MIEGVCKDATALQGGDQKRETAGHKEEIMKREREENRRKCRRVESEQSRGVRISQHVVIAAESRIPCVVCCATKKEKSPYV